MGKLWILVLVLFVVSLASCSSEDESKWQYEEFKYKSEQINFTVSSEIMGTWVKDENLYYYFTKSNFPDPPHLVVTSIDLDSKEKQYIEIPIERGTHVVGLHCNNEGNIGILAVLSKTIFYAVYDLSGVELHRLNYYELTSQGAENFQLEHCIFIEDGVIITAFVDFEPYLYFLDSNTDQFTEIKLRHMPFDIKETNNGSVIALINDRNNLILQEVNIAAGNMGKVVSGSLPEIGGLVSVDYNSPFDIMIINNSDLIGYCFSTDDKATILNWVEAGFSDLQGAYIGSLSDNRVYLLEGEWNEHDVWDARLYILTPVSRDTLPELITLTLGGVWLTDEIRQSVVDFNRESQTHQILIHDYIDEADWDLQAANLRLRTEFIAGKGPDIVFNPEPALVNRGFLVDLYPLIDNDDDLSRFDFQSNALAALENNDGSLATVSNGFFISTILGKTETVGHLDSWTVSDLLALVESNAQKSSIFGNNMNRIFFCTILIELSGNDFIDWQTNKAFLDSEEFIHLLKVAKYLPGFDSDWVEVIVEDEFAKINRNEQLLLMSQIGTPTTYQSYFIGLRDFLAIGIPTTAGGVHVMLPTFVTNVGINASSDYIEDAWTFVRRILLPTKIDDYFPIRIDQFEEVIDIAMTPIVKDGKEIPRITYWQVEGFEMEFFAMTQKEADELRLIVESAVPSANSLGLELYYHILEDLEVFFADARTAEDTARIMQNRVQTYLNEQR